MKRFAVLGLCLCLFPCCAMTAFAKDTTSSTVPTNDAVISVSVPSAHLLTVTAPDDITVLLDGQSSDTFNVERFSEPMLEIKAPDGKEIVKVTLNGEDITDKLNNGQYKLPPVYEGLFLEIETKAAEITTAEPTTSTSEPTTESTTEPSSPTTSTATTSNNNGGINNSDNRTYPNNDSPNTGDMAIGGISLTMLLGIAMLVVSRKRKDKDE